MSKVGKCELIGEDSEKEGEGDAEGPGKFSSSDMSMSGTCMRISGELLDEAILDREYNSRWTRVRKEEVSTKNSRNYMSNYESSENFQPNDGINSTPFQDESC